MPYFAWPYFRSLTVLVLYLSIFILRKFDFYFTTYSTNWFIFWTGEIITCSFCERTGSQTTLNDSFTNSQTERVSSWQHSDSNDLVRASLELTTYWFKWSSQTESPVNDSLIQMIQSDRVSSQRLTDSNDPVRQSLQSTTHWFKWSGQTESPVNDSLIQMIRSDRVSSQRCNSLINHHSTMHCCGNELASQVCFPKTVASPSFEPH